MQEFFDLTGSAEMELISYEKSDVVFEQLKEGHFELMLVWLQTPHVKEWWDSEILWTMAKIQEKYASYVQGYKMVAGKREAIDAFIVVFKGNSVGYIQAYDLRRHNPGMEFGLDMVPEKLASIDVFLGEVNVLGKGLGSFVIQEFLERVVAEKFDICGIFVDEKNLPAHRVYERAGFKELLRFKSEIFLINLRLS